MAFKKTLVQRLFNLSRFSTPNLSPTRTTIIKPDPKPNRIFPNPRRPIHQSTAASPPSTAAMRLFPITGAALSETLKGMDITKGRLNLDGLIAEAGPTTPKREEENAGSPLTVGEVRKVLMATQAEVIRDKLRSYGKDWVSYGEYLELIGEYCGGNKDLALMFATNLDDCGSVIVLGNSVCLRPLQVAKAIHSLVTPPLSADPNDPRRKELELMEEQKAEIDQKADALVRRELWAGLGYMVVQTAGFMRLTFWELSWDVMEPICFYVTSAYFMLGYTFFLRTSKEPSFEGFFKSRFNAKQKRLMKAREFNIERYNELRKVFYPHSSSSSTVLDDTRLIRFDCHKAN
ncbi:calcium uniporter protein 2, mitochondrial isoform X2 [Silene latifolia]|uniref:calcium uniporter protein 2, mitochondrial isoform X2 n=1 Tax=Silene latifolia TaxID=37657 RepID=UPI003D77CC57